MFAANASTPAEVSRFFKNNYPNLTTAKLDEINELYPRQAALPQSNAYFPSVELAYGNATLICSGTKTSLAIAKYASGKSWNYRYNVHSSFWDDKGDGVVHLAEGGSIFALDNSPVAQMVQQYWLSFVQTLDPNTLKGASAPVWRSFAGAGANSTGQRLRFETDSTEMEDIPAMQEKRCQFWWDAHSQMQQ